MNKIFSGTLLLAGTSIGGGMILLPVIIGVYGYFSAIAVLFAIWALNICVAFILLEANTYLPKGTNFISMAKTLLGDKAKIFTWIISLGFLYTLMCVYISGVTEILSSYIHIPQIYLSLLSILLVGLPIYFGISRVSQLNAIIVALMFFTFFIILFFLIPSTHIQTLVNIPNKLPLLALPVVFTSFGYLNLVPSMREYFDDDFKKIKSAILLGSVLPLICYIVLTTIIMSIIPISGEGGLQSILEQKEPILTYTQSLILYSQNTSLALIIEVFIFCAIVSSFIGIALSLYDFLTDGLQISKTSVGKLKLLGATFLPPFFISLAQSQLYLKALGFAGLVATLLYGLYPILLTISGRYRLKLQPQYKVPFNFIVFFLVTIGCFIIIGVELKT